MKNRPVAAKATSRMRTRLTQAVLVLAMIVLVVPTADAGSLKWPIYVRATTDDVTGTTYVYQLKKQIRASQDYELATAESGAAFVISIVTDDPFAPPQSGVLTIASIVLAVAGIPKEGDELLLQHWLMRARRDQVPAVALDTLASVDKAVNEWIEHLRRR